MLAALQNWTDHTASRPGRCKKFGKKCSFMRTMPQIQKICLKGSNKDSEESGSRRNSLPEIEKISLKESINSGEEGSGRGEGSSDEEGCGSGEGWGSGEDKGGGEDSGSGEKSGIEDSGRSDSCPGCCCQVQ